MNRATLLVLGISLATGAVALIRSAPWGNAEPVRRPFATTEPRTAAREEAARASERAALLDRQAGAALLASDRATFRAAALAARVQQAEAAAAASQAELSKIDAARQTLDMRLARESAPVAHLVGALYGQVRRPAVVQMLQPGSVADAVHVRAMLVAMEPQIRGRTADLRGKLANARTLQADSVRLAERYRIEQAVLATRRAELASSSAAARLTARRAASAADREAERAYAIGTRVPDLAPFVGKVDTRSPAKPSATVNAAAAYSGLDAAQLAAPHRIPVQGRPVPRQSGLGKGLTLEVQPGALVVAPGPGRIAFAGPYRGFGMIVIVEHGGGWISLMTGLATAQATVGQRVIAGTALGQAAARDPRITIELRHNGISIDPATRLR